MRACTNCQRRKSRCLLRGSPGDGPCSYCARTGKTCSFETPPDRTPLTRKNLDACEHRCSQLRLLLSSLNPDLDIESALAKAGAADRDGAARQGPEETDESTPGSYEWHEGSLSPEDRLLPQDEGVANDGMATLSRAEAGYLGSSSGSQLLEEIDSAIPNGTRHGPPRTQRKQQHAGAPQLDPPDLPLSYAANRLIDAYFLLYNSCYPILHERTFRDRVAAKQQQRLGHSPWRVTYYMVLAIGHWASTTEAEHMQSKYYSAARASLSLQMLESGTIETVLAFLLMGNYLQKRDRTNTGYNFIGLAYRLGIGLGLHREPPGPGNTIGHERRRHIFWTMYCIESGFNITTGRPPTMAEGFADTRVPLNIDDKDLTFSSIIPSAVNYPTTSSAIIAQAQLAKIADAIYHEFLLAKTAGSRVEYKVAESMERDLVNWRASLPSYFTSTEVPDWFRGPRSVVLWKEQNIRILLWRGSHKHHSFLPTKVNGEDKCLDAAMQTIHDISTFCTENDGAIYQSVSWYATYFLFQAALVLVASFLNKTNPREPSADEFPWQHSVFKARESLSMLSRGSRSAARCLQMLEEIHSQFQALPTMNQEMTHLESVQQPNSHLWEPAMPPPPIPTDSQLETALPSENDFAFYGDNQLGLNDDTSDPNLRMLINEMSFDLMENMPLDLLLNDWVD